MYLPLVLALVIAATPCSGEPIAAAEVKVTDGDTVKARGERYRLIGFDTPETWSFRRFIWPSERALGKRARDRLKELLTTGLVDLTEKPCECTKDTRYDAQGRCRTNGRLCAVLTVDGRDVGPILISEGLAREFICSDNKCPQQQEWPRLQTGRR